MHWRGHMKLGEVAGFRRKKVAESISIYLGVESSQLELLGQFSNGAINDHFLFSCSSGYRGVWRERNEVRLPVACQNSLKTEALLIAEMNKGKHTWCPTAASSLGENVNDGLVLDVIDGDDRPEHFFDDLEDDAFWHATAKIMVELHSASLQTHVIEALKPNCFSSVLFSIKGWVANQRHAQSQEIARELEFIASQLNAGKSAPVLCHNDFRMGNLVRSQSGQVFLLDWEFANLGEREQDIGWFFAPCWRYAKQEILEQNLNTFIAFYQELCDFNIDKERVKFWRYAAQVRWSAIALMQEWRLKKLGRVSNYLSDPQQNPQIAMSEAARLKKELF
jgi:aminoglycoside phosphotransferase (APT) family kinase protein